VLTEEPSEGAAILVDLVDVKFLRFSLVILRPVIRDFPTPDLVRVRIVELEVLFKITPALVPVSPVMLNSIMLEEKTLVTLKRSVEISQKLDLTDLDVIAEELLGSNEGPHFEHSSVCLQSPHLLVPLDTVLLLSREVDHGSEFELIRDLHLFLIDDIGQVLITFCEVTEALSEWESVAFNELLLGGEHVNRVINSIEWLNTVTEGLRKEVPGVTRLEAWHGEDIR